MPEMTAMVTKIPGQVGMTAMVIKIPGQVEMTAMVTKIPGQVGTTIWPGIRIISMGSRQRGRTSG